MRQKSVPNIFWYSLNLLMLGLSFYLLWKAVSHFRLAYGSHSNGLQLSLGIYINLETITSLFSNVASFQLPVNGTSLWVNNVQRKVSAKGNAFSSCFSFIEVMTNSELCNKSVLFYFFFLIIFLKEVSYLNLLFNFWSFHFFIKPY